jgi:hypothetical protein
MYEINIRDDMNNAATFYIQKAMTTIPAKCTIHFIVIGKSLLMIQ